MKFKKNCVTLALILECVNVNAVESRVNDSPGIIPLKPVGNPGLPEDSIPLDPPISRSPMHVPAIVATLDEQYICVDATVFSPEYVTVTIYDEYGNIVLSDTYSSSTVFGIDLSALSIGAYTIALEVGGCSYVGEFEI